MLCTNHYDPQEIQLVKNSIKWQEFPFKISKYGILEIKTHFFTFEVQYSIKHGEFCDLMMELGDIFVENILQGQNSALNK